jgi:hypothetical protein
MHSVAPKALGYEDLNEQESGFLLDPAQIEIAYSCSPPRRFQAPTEPRLSGEAPYPWAEKSIRGSSRLFWLRRFGVEINESHKAAYRCSSRGVG